jgi:hypothetical protein
MHDLNQELLETLLVAMEWIRQSEKIGLEIPKKATFLTLMKKGEALLEEISSEPIATDGFLQRRRTDGDLTEPTEGVGCAHIDKRALT